MTPRHELAPQRDRRKRVAGLSEGRQQEAPRLGARRLRGDPLRSSFAQSASASARMICERPSALGAIGLVISVPTPASR